jgi:hypothetical protein
MMRKSNSGHAPLNVIRVTVAAPPRAAGSLSLVL